MSSPDSYETLQRDLEAAQTIEEIEQYLERTRGLMWMYQEAWMRARNKLEDLGGDVPLQDH